MNPVTWVGFEKRSTMVKHTSCKIGHPHIGVSSTLARVSEKEINSFLDKSIYITSIHLGESRPSEPISIMLQ